MGQRPPACPSRPAECQSTHQGIYQGDYLACGMVACHEKCNRTPYPAADGDNDVDMLDFAEFQRCLNAVDVSSGCGCFDQGNGFADGRIDAAQSHGIQTQMLPRAYLGDLDTLALNTDDCLVRISAADGFRLSGGMFLP